MFLGQLQSVTKDKSNQDHISKIIFNLHATLKKINDGSMSASQIGKLVSNVLNTVKIHFKFTGGHKVVGGSAADQLRNIFVLLNQLKTTSSNGSTSGASALLQLILNQLNSLQLVAPSSINRIIVQLIAKVRYVHQQSVAGSINVGGLLQFIQVAIDKYYRIPERPKLNNEC